MRAPPPTPIIIRCACLIYPPLLTHQVRALASTPQYALLSELVAIFAHGQLGAYSAFAEKNAAFLADTGVDGEKRCVECSSTTSSRVFSPRISVAGGGVGRMREA